MTVETWSLYVLAVLAVMSTPGPSQLLMLSVAGTNGFRRSLFTAAGDLTANALQMAAAGFGLAAVVARSEGTLAIVQGLGVAYLAWLGARMLLGAGRGAAGAGQGAGRASPRRLWTRGFVASAVNPKAVIFFAALFPQFIDRAQPVLPQVLILSATYIVMDACFLSLYGLSADRIARLLRGGARVWIDRLGGAFMIAAAVLLGLKGVAA